MKLKSKQPSLGSMILERLEGFQTALESGVPITKRFTCRTMELPAPAAELAPNDIKGIRDILNVSQAIFGRFLGVSQKTVQSWEQGVSHPSEMARRFLGEIKHNPRYWTRRLKQLAADNSA